jgi:hypothetical protein
MRTIKMTLLLAFLTIGTISFAQSESHGHTLNLGLGVGGYAGYYNHVDHSIAVFNINYEFDVANNFTLAPFVTFYTNRYDHYRETVIPIGVKGSYYFDQILEANSNWDFYLAGSLGFAVVKSYWDNDYYGDRDYYVHPNPLFLDLHIGAEYHFNNHIGAFLDLSTGVSTIGIAIH